MVAETMIDPRVTAKDVQQTYHGMCSLDDVDAFVRAMQKEFGDAPVHLSEIAARFPASDAAFALEVVDVDSAMPCRPSRFADRVARRFALHCADRAVGYVSDKALADVLRGHLSEARRIVEEAEARGVRYADSIVDVYRLETAMREALRAMHESRGRCIGVIDTVDGKAADIVLTACSFGATMPPRNLVAVCAFGVSRLAWLRGETGADDAWVHRTFAASLAKG